MNEGQNKSSMSDVEGTMAAIEAVVRILGPLESEERQRVIHGALVILREPIVGQTRIDVGQSSEDGAAANTVGISPRARTWMRQNTLVDDQLAHVFDISDGVATVIVSDVSGRSVAEKVMKVYALAGIASLLASGEPTFSDKE